MSLRFAYFIPQDPGPVNEQRVKVARVMATGRASSEQGRTAVTRLIDKGAFSEAMLVARGEKVLLTAVMQLVEAGRLPARIP